MASRAVSSRVMRLDSLTGLRWWAAFAVFLYHLAPSGAVGVTTRTYFGVGHTGVEFFFILSGFVLTWSARPQVGARQFWVRRFARIWPAHFVALLAALPVFYSFTPDPEQWWVKPYTLGPLLLSVFLLQGFFAAPGILYGGNPAAWTLSCEAMFYALFPGLRPVIRRLSVPLLWGAGVLAVVFGIAFKAMPQYLPPLPPAVRLMWLFVLGAVIAALLRRGRTLRMNGNIVAVVLLIIFVLSNIGTVQYWGKTFAHYYAYWGAVGLPLVYALAIWALASGEAQGAKCVFNSRWMVIGGEWSYAFYLVHATVLYGWRELIGGIPTSILGGSISFLVVFALSLGAAAALHYLVERPCESRIRAWGDRRFGVPAKAASS